MEAETRPGSEAFSFQDAFPKSIECVHCDCEKEAELIFVAHEMDRKNKEFLCRKHDNDPEGEGFWFHDAACFANYVCRKCFKVTAIWNQA